MALPTGSFTGTADISNLVKAAYDQYVRMALRSIPVMRALADVKPVQQAMPGSSVVFSIYSDLSAATSTLTETLDVSSIALGNPSQVTVTLNEYGSAVTTTKKLNLTSFNDVDAALADIIAYNAADSIDSVVATVLTGGTNVIYGGNATTTNTIDAADTISVADIRNAVTELRTNKALPRLGELYAAYLHPRQAADLRAESGTGGFQDIVKYTDNVSKTIIPGSVGVIEGAFVVETPRVPFAANTNSPAVNVYKAVVAGREALAEAMGQDINTVIGPEIDALRRFRTIGWYYFGGFARLREAALYRIETSASAG
jgi:N4-gp56 family major capsid protein